MKQFFKLKTLITTFLMITSAVAISVVIVAIQFKGDIRNAQAEKEKNVSGFAWSSNFGWISFNSTDCDANDDNLSDGTPAGCPALNTAIPDYGVNIDPVTGNFSGYAWSNNIGWIQFAPAGPYPEAPFYSAKKGSDWKITGWAKILSLGDDGWLKMSDDSNVNWTNKGVSIRGDNSFYGWAWNGDANGNTGLGWLSFNSDNPEDTDSFVYEVKYNPSSLAPSIPTNLRTTMLDCNTMRLDWDDTSNEDSYEGQYDDGVSGYQPLADCSTAQNVNYCSLTMPASATWKFQIRARNSFGVSAWSAEAVGATLYCAPSGLTITQKNCSKVVLSWTLTAGVDHYNVLRSENGGAPVSIKDGLTVNTYTDLNIKSGFKYIYYIVACNADNSYCQTGDPSEEITPCPNAPSWHEVNPK